jgi:hypothetical protein
MRELFGAFVLACINLSGGHFLLRGHRHDIVSDTYLLDDLSIASLGQISIYTLACRQLFHSPPIEAGFGSFAKSTWVNSPRQTALKRCLLGLPVRADTAR